MIDKYTTDKIYNAAQIVDVVSDFVTLRKRGVNYVGLCPFHSDNTPSFYVSPSKNICKCFACGEGGTSVQFIMKHEQVSYYEALRYLAKKYNIEIRERELTDEDKRMQSDRESMVIINSWAQKFFTSRLYEHEEGRRIGMSYFAERGFRDDIIRKFQLGYSLNKRDDLFENATERGFNEVYLFKTGLVYKRDDGTVADRFHGRVVFPVHTLSGKVIAFGGRVLGKKDKVAKYVNSPESEIYHKSNELYGVYFARQAIVKADKCYLVEGYTDVISMHQTGIENVVASSGTSLTDGQIRLIHRFTNNITVLYDGDAAGIKAAMRGIDMLLAEGMNVKVVLLPEGEDPDSFARSHNSFDFTLYINEHEVDFIRFKADLLLKEADNDPVRRINLIKEMMETIAVIPDNITRSVYIKECSRFFDEREQLLIDEVIKIRSRRIRSAQRIPAQRTSPPSSSDSSLSDSLSPGSPSPSHLLPSDSSLSDSLSPSLSPDSSLSVLSSLISPSPSPSDSLSPLPDSSSTVSDLSVSAHQTTTAQPDSSPAISAQPADAVQLNPVSSVFARTASDHPFKKYELILLRYVIRYGERILFSDGESDENSDTEHFVSVSEYIQSELQKDEIEIQTPIYRRILEEAIVQLENEDFTASHYFLTHPDLEISRLATDMISNKYPLSKYFDNPEEVALKQTTISDERQEAENEARKREKERDQLERWIVHDIFTLKNAYIKHKIDYVNKQIRECLSDEEKVMMLLKKRMELDRTKIKLSKELGERIITGIGG
ncbi:MAG: DNA primase [Tannerella sp.]|jgi:DNA primase|nr:DNA primase [Tannerella sp.]